MIFFIFEQGEITYIWFFQLNETKVSNSQDITKIRRLYTAKHFFNHVKFVHILLRMAKHGVILVGYLKFVQQQGHTIYRVDIHTMKKIHCRFKKKNSSRTSVLISIKLVYQPNIAQSILGEEELKFVQKKVHAFSQGRW